MTPRLTKADLVAALAQSQATIAALEAGVVASHHLMAEQMRHAWLEEHVEHGTLAVLPATEAVRGIPAASLTWWVCPCGARYLTTESPRVGR